MDSKRKNSTQKSLPKHGSKSVSREKKAPSPAPRQSKRKTNAENLNPQVSHLKKKSTQQLTKKKIEQLKPPEILIKVMYKGKRISIPIATCDDRNLSDTVLPHIIRFEKDVLENEDFNTQHIVNWKCSGRVDVLKDYYFQTNRPIKIFKGQLLEIEPIWKTVRCSGRIQLSDFEVIKCIGTGGFSRVFLARLKSNGTFFALKLMQKQGLFESGKECVVSNQRNIMVGLNSPHIVNLEFAFETKHFVALALQYCPGGELFYYLRKVRKMTEDQARYCFIQILLGIQYLHNQHIVYRDIKPENIMIDAEGNLKIADFGLSKEGLRPNELATTYCGSPQYMAPEMLSKSGHSYAVDYYCMGALLYELVTGNPPFYSRDVEKIYHSIQNDEIDFPSHVELSPEIKMLLEGLLVKDPKKRLGSMGGIREILGHPWVRKLKAADIVNKTVPTPINIDILTFNVNEEEIEEGGDDFLEKFAEEDSNFDDCFEDFYFNRYEGQNILEQAFPSVKSESTKDNKNMKIRYPSASKDNSKRIIALKSSQQRDNYQKFTIGIENTHEYPTSDIHRNKPKKLKKLKSKKQICLIERAKKRDDKSVIRNGHEKERSPINLRKMNADSAGLKRIKSSTALLNTLKRQK